MTFVCECAPVLIAGPAPSVTSASDEELLALADDSALLSRSHLPI